MNSQEGDVKEKFRMTVHRSMVLNEYENKKNSKIGLLIEQVVITYYSHLIFVFS